MKTGPELARIVEMLRKGSAELQCAAAMVLGELAPRDPTVHRALLNALKSHNESVRLYAVEALGRISPREAAPHLIPFLAGSPRLRARVQQILTGLGEEIVPLLQKHIDKAPPELRSGILEVLGQFKAVDLSDTLLEGLLDRDPEVVRRAGEALRGRYEGRPADERQDAARRVMALFKSARPKPSPVSLGAGLGVLGALKVSSAARFCLELVDPKRPVEVRSAALGALASLDLADEEDRVLRRLLPLLEEEDQANVVSPALQVLAPMRVGREHADRVQRLLHSRHAAVRLFAIRVLGASGTAGAAEGLIEGLFSQDARVAEEAASALRGHAAFARAVLHALDRERDINRAWKLANVLRAYRDALDGARVRAFVRRFFDLHAKGEPTAQVYFEVLRGAAPAALREDVLKRGQALLGSKKWDEAARLLHLVEREDIATDDTEYARAVALLKTMKKDLAFANRDRSAATFLFGKLARRAAFPVLKALERDAKILGPADLLYLGFVLVERQGAERDLGADVLRLVVRKFTSSREATTAKAKLKTQGA